jgi:hypothetical protein
LSLIPKPCSFGNIFKLKITFVEVKFIGSHIGREEDIGETIVIDIAGGYARAIVKVPVTEYVEDVLS